MRQLLFVTFFHSPLDKRGVYDYNMIVNIKFENEDIEWQTAIIAPNSVTVF